MFLSCVLGLNFKVYFTVTYSASSALIFSHIKHLFRADLFYFPRFFFIRYKSLTMTNTFAMSKRGLIANVRLHRSSTCLI